MAVFLSVIPKYSTDNRGGEAITIGPSMAFRLCPAITDQKLPKIRRHAPPEVRVYQDESPIEGSEKWTREEEKSHLLKYSPRAAG